MSYWRAKFPNDYGEYEITFASKYKYKTKIVEKVCQAIIDKKVDSVDDISIGNTAPQWIPVTERLPERDEKCLCRYTFGEKELMYFYQVLDYYATDPQPHFQHTLGDNGMRVTHWMPLPKPPESDPTKERLLRACEQIIKAYEDGGAENEHE